MMQLNIEDFLQKIALEAQVLPQVRELVLAEIEKYEGMRLILSNTEQNPDFTRNLLDMMDTYLEYLKLVYKKFQMPQLALVKINNYDKPEINKAVLQILKTINQKH